MCSVLSESCFSILSTPHYSASVLIALLRPSGGAGDTASFLCCFLVFTETVFLYAFTTEREKAFNDFLLINIWQRQRLLFPLSFRKLVDIFRRTQWKLDVVTTTQPHRFILDIVKAPFVQGCSVFRTLRAAKLLVGLGIVHDCLGRITLCF